MALGTSRGVRFYGQHPEQQNSTLTDMLVYNMSVTGLRQGINLADTLVIRVYEEL